MQTTRMPSHTSRVQNLDALFPHGDNMVAIIDDCPSVWHMRANLVPVSSHMPLHGSMSVDM